MKLNRRSFFKKSILGLLALPIFTKATGLLQPAQASAGAKGEQNDSKIKKQGYVHDAKTIDAMKDGKKKYKKYFKAKTADFQPSCLNCKFYKKAKGDYATCAMVGANGKPGKWVYKDGMCKVYAKKKKKKA